MTLKKIALAALFLGSTLMMAPASASPIFNWTFRDNAFVLVASGTVTTGAPVTLNIPAAQTVYPVTSGTGSLYGVDGFTAENFTLYGNYIAPLGYFVVGGQTYDNAIIGGLPHLDGNGLEFTGNTSSFYFNIYNSVNTGAYAPGNYPNGDILWNNVGNLITGTFDIAAVPEPSTWTMLITAFGLMGFAMRRRPATKGQTVYT